MSEPMEVQDVVASTLATPFAQPIIAASKSKAQKQREYRQRIAASRTPAQAAAARKLKNERQRNNRLRKAANLAIVSGSLEATTTSSSRSGEESNNVQIRSQRQQRVNLTNEPLFPAIPVPMEVHEAVASSSATPFAKPITAARKTRAQIEREYRQRKVASRTPAQAAAAREARNARDRNNRLRQAANLAIASGPLEATTTSSSRSGQRLNTVHIDTQRQFTDQQRQTLATEPAETTVQPSTSDQIEIQAQSTWNTKWTCSVCDRLRFRNDLKPITAAQLKVISDWFIKENRQLSREEYKLVCNTCKKSLNKKSMPLLAKVNGFSYPDPPSGLTPLDPISERLISPRLPFMQVRRLRHDFSYGTVGQVITVPVEVQEMVKCSPRQLDEDVNINIKRNLAETSKIGTDEINYEKILKEAVKKELHYVNNNNDNINYEKFLKDAVKKETNEDIINNETQFVTVKEETELIDNLKNSDEIDSIKIEHSEFQIASPEARRNLYEGHQIQGEMVLGPMIVQNPNVVYAIQNDLQNKTSCKPANGAPMSDPLFIRPYPIKKEPCEFSLENKSMDRMSCKQEPADAALISDSDMFVELCPIKEEKNEFSLENELLMDRKPDVYSIKAEHFVVADQ